MTSMLQLPSNYVYCMMKALDYVCIPIHQHHRARLPHYHPRKDSSKLNMAKGEH